VIERWTPPHYDPPAPIAWFLSLTWQVRAALLFAYWLYVAAAGVMAGLSVIGSLIGSALGIGAVVGSYVAMIAARRREWDDEPREDLWRVVAGTCAGICWTAGGAMVVVPAIIVLVLAFWAIASVPILLFRR
jgi:hypothetical protein